MSSSIIEGYRLSPEQSSLYGLTRDLPRAPYRALCAVLVEGPLCLRTLSGALQQVSDRHEILRTVFLPESELGLPLQVICDPRQVSLSHCDLSELSVREREEQIEELWQSAREADFDLAHGPLWRVCLARLTPRAHLLLFSLPALCADAKGVQRLVHEIGRSYGARLNSQRLLDEPLQYADIAEWRHELFESGAADVGRQHWAQHDLRKLEMLKLPFERSGEQGFAPQSLGVRIEGEEWKRLVELGKQSGVRERALLMACWEILLGRWCGEPKLTLGLIQDGRSYRELEEVIGPLTKALPIESQLWPERKYLELASELDEQMKAAEKWQECFRWEEYCDGKVEGTGEPYFPFSYEYESGLERQVVGDLCFSLVRRYVCVDRFKIKLSCEEMGDGVVAEIHYDASKYEEEEIGRLVRGYQSLLRDIVEDWEVVIGDMDGVGDSERERLLVVLNQTELSYPTESLLHELFAAQVERTPETIALVYMEAHVSYAELNCRANQLAHYLRGIGVGPEVLVGTLMERSLEMVIALLGVLKAGGAYVPLDPQYPPERLSSMINDARPLVLLTQRHLLTDLQVHNGRLLCLDTEWKVVAQQSEENLLSEATAYNLAYVIYTSGSTGKPKGAMNLHQGVLNRMLWMQDAYRLTMEDRVLQKTPFSFDVSVWEFFWPLLNGACLVVAQPGGHQDPSYLVKIIKTQKITTIHFVPSMLRWFLKERGVEERTTLRRIICSGEVLSLELQESTAELMNAQLYNLYGPTEAAIDVTSWVCRPQSGRHSVPIGKPIANTQIYLLNECLLPVPLGCTGQLYIGGINLARGYLERPDLTAERFIPDSFGNEAGRRLYWTGDLARHLLDGNLDYLGRIDDQVKLRGFRVELGEIEAVLRQHPAVRDCVCLVRRENEESDRLMAYVVSDPDSTPSVDQLRSYLQEKLPDYMIPSAFLLLDHLPLTPNGKLDRRALPQPARHRSDQAPSGLGARSALERELVEIWQEVLGISPIGIRDKFLELGGHSLLLLRLKARVRQRFDREIALETLVQTETIEELAELLGQSQGEPRDSILITLQPGSHKAPFFCVHPATGSGLAYMELARAVGTDQPFYGLQSRVREPLEEIEEMATSYLEAMRSLRIEGPYLLGGWSMGGLVAYEMAVQLVSQGKEVGLLALFDRAAYEQKAKDERELRVLFEQVVKSVREKRKLNGGSGLELDAPSYEQYFEVFKKNYRAAEKYVPKAYRGVVTLFSSEETRNQVKEPTLGWGGLAEGVEIYEMPGTHTSMLMEPNVQVVAQRLKRVLAAKDQVVIERNGSR